MSEETTELFDEAFPFGRAAAGADSPLAGGCNAQPDAKALESDCAPADNCAAVKLFPQDFPFVETNHGTDAAAISVVQPSLFQSGEFPFTARTPVEPPAMEALVADANATAECISAPESIFPRGFPFAEDCAAHAVACDGAGDPHAATNTASSFRSANGAESAFARRDGQTDAQESGPDAIDEHDASAFSQDLAQRANWAGPERRRTLREHLLAKATLRTDGSRSTLIQAKVVNVSLHGVAVETSHPLEAGEKFTIRLSAGPVRWATRARVVCRRPGAGGRHLVGAVFAGNELIRDIAEAA